MDGLNKLDGLNRLELVLLLSVSGHLSKKHSLSGRLNQLCPLIDVIKDPLGNIVEAQKLASPEVYGKIAKACEELGFPEYSQKFYMTASLVAEILSDNPDKMKLSSGEEATGVRWNYIFRLADAATYAGNAGDLFRKQELLTKLVEKAGAEYRRLKKENFRGGWGCTNFSSSVLWKLESEGYLREAAYFLRDQARDEQLDYYKKSLLERADSLMAKTNDPNNVLDKLGSDLKDIDTRL